LAIPKEAHPARRPGRKAGRCVGLREEAFFGLDFFGTFCIKAKSMKRRMSDKLQQELDLVLDGYFASELVTGF
jgi:hypothetical protein